MRPMQPSVMTSWYVGLHTAHLYAGIDKVTLQGKTAMLNVEYKVQKEVRLIHDLTLHTIMCVFWMFLCSVCFVEHLQIYSQCCS